MILFPWNPQNFLLYSSLCMVYDEFSGGTGDSASEMVTKTDMLSDPSIAEYLTGQ